MPIVERKRPRCKEPDCGKPAMLKQRLNGVKRYRGRCASHQRANRLLSDATQTNRCQRCGWKGECHRHRMTPETEGGRYTKGNIALLCPNCHAAAHDKGEWNKPQE